MSQKNLSVKLLISSDVFVMVVYPGKREGKHNINRYIDMCNFWGNLSQ